MRGRPIAMIDNVLALRGDPPKGAADWTPVEGGFEYANELAAELSDGPSLQVHS